MESRDMKSKQKSSAARPDAGLVHLRDASDDLKPAEGMPDVHGWDVKTSDGEKIGKVDDLLVDTLQRKVRYIEVNVSKDALNTEDDRYHLFPIGTARLDDDADEVTLEATAADIRALPVYERNINHVHDEKLLRNQFSPAGSTIRVDDSKQSAEDFYRDERFDEKRFVGSRGSKQAGRDARYFAPAAADEVVVEREVVAGDRGALKETSRQDAVDRSRVSKDAENREAR